MNDAENFVSDVCHKTFLSLWSFPNPLGKKGKELCDFFVVCDPYIIIFSVKHIQIKPSGDEALDVKRWNKRAIEDSIEQLYGAERYLKSVDTVILKDRKTVISIPSKTTRRIFRVAVSIGRKNEYPINQEDFGQGYVHIFDAPSFLATLNELGTVTDIVDYLKAKEDFLLGCSCEFFKEEDILAYYLMNERTFPLGHDSVCFDDTIWDSYINHPQYIAKKKIEGPSYIWDEIIEILQKDYGPEYSNFQSREEREMALRTMAKETRLSRRILGKSILEILEKVANTTHKSMSRLFKSDLNINVAYVLTAGPGDKRRQRRDILERRCLVARGIVHDCEIIIGIATEPRLPYEVGRSYDFFYLETADWTEQMAKEAKEIQKEYGFFLNSKIKQGIAHEFPPIN